MVSSLVFAVFCSSVPTGFGLASLAGWVTAELSSVVGGSSAARAPTGAIERSMTRAITLAKKRFPLFFSNIKNYLL